MHMSTTFIHEYGEPVNKNFVVDGVEGSTEVQRH